MLKKAIMVVSGNAFASIFLLLRNLLVARLVSPDNYGIASTFAISMSVVEMFSYLGLNQLMVVDKNGDDPHFQASMQGFQVMRGAFSFLVLFLIAEPYARFLGLERVAWSYEVLALVPLIYGFQHYDQHRAKRHLNFTPSVLANSVPALVSVLTIWPLALVFGDYRIMLFAIFAQAITTVAITHWTAKRPYRLAWDTGLMRRAVRFGWPLLLDGILIFGTYNGEKLVILRELGVSEFAFFTMAFTLTVTPVVVLSMSSQSLFLPQLTAARTKPAEFQRLAVAAVESTLAITVLLLIGTCLVGGPLAYLLTGPKYLPILSLLIPMALLQGTRVAKNGANTVALALGHSSASMLCNLVRIGSLPLSWWFASTSGNVAAVIWTACAAEVLAFMLAMYLAVRWARLELRPLLLPALLTALLVFLAGYEALSAPPGPNLLDNLDWMLALILVVGLVALASMKEGRSYVLAALRRRR